MGLTFIQAFTLLTVASTVVGSTYVCPMCKLAVKVIQNNIYENKDVIEKLINQECIQFCPTICPFIDKEIANLINIVDNSTIPETVCKYVGLCPVIDGCHTEMVCSCCPTSCSVRLVC